MSSEAKPKPKSEFNVVKLAIVGAVSLAIGLIPPPEGIEAVGMHFIAGFIFMVGAMLTGAAPMWGATNLTGVIMVLTKTIPLSVVYGAWSGSTIWMVIGVISMAGILTKTGVMKRVAYAVMSIFPPTYTGQVLALTTTSVVLSPIIPSSSAKIAIVTPLAAALGKEIGLEPHSKGLVGLWFIVMMNAFVLAHTFLTGSNITFMMLGMMPAEVAGPMSDWMTWFSATWVWGIVIIVGSVFATLLTCKPKEAVSMTKSYIQEKIAELGPWSKNEKIGITTLGFCVVMWLTAGIHKIDATSVTWVGVFVLAIAGMITTRETALDFPWAMIFMFAPMMGMVDYMRPAGVTDFLAGVLGPVIAPLIPNAFVFVIVEIVIIMVLRLFLDQISILAIAVAVLFPIAAVVGVSPWVVMFLTWANAQIWILPHNNLLTIQMAGMMGGTLEFKDMQPMTWWYMIITAIGSLASVPLWIGLGLIQ